MANARSTLERIRDRFVPSRGGFERLVARRDRRLRIRRIMAATLALALSAGLFLGLWSVMRTIVSPTPRPGGAFTVRVGGTPVDVGVGEGSVWVAIVTDPSGRGEVVRIDPTDGRVVARISLPKVGALAVGEGSVWVANLRHETVTRIDPATDEVADVIDMPPLPYEVAEGDRAFLPEGITIGFGRVWVSTARGSVASIDPGPGEASVVISDLSAILGGVTAGAGSVWAWNTFEPPDAEVWRISPESDEIGRILVPATVLDAVAGAAGLFVLHAETGDISLVGAVDPLQGRVEGAVLVGTVGERANTIAVVDPTVYVAAATGNIYAIDQGSGDMTLLTRVPGEPTALGVTPDALWVTAADGTVTEVPLEREVVPEPTVVPTPTAPSSPPQEAAEPFALWPEDTTEEAQAVGPERYAEPRELVTAFASEVLGWEGARVSPAEPGHGGRTAFVVERGDGPQALVVLDQPLEGLWSVVGVSVLEPEGVDDPVSVDVRGKGATVWFERLGAEIVEVRIGYGTGPELSAEAASGIAQVEIDLTGVDRTRPGHLLIVFRDGQGRVFAAKGSALPAGDYAAG